MTNDGLCDIFMVARWFWSVFCGNFFDGSFRGCSLVEVGSKGDSSSCLVVFFRRLLFVSLDNFSVRGCSAAMVVLVG